MHVLNTNKYWLRPLWYILGGSVDISVHKKFKDGTLEELIPATGRPFGGILVDGEYEKFLETIGGKGIFKSYATGYMEDFLAALRDFERIKREINQSKVRIRIPESLERLICSRTGCLISEALQNTIYKQKVTYKNFKFCLPFSEFKTFFKTVLDRVTNYIEDIFANNDIGCITEIFLVGGFSECSIIQNALRERFETCHFIFPKDAQIAVLKGAVYLGHIPIVKSKITEKELHSKSTRLCVAAISIGNTYSGYAFSWKYDWSKVYLGRINACNFVSKKEKTSLLLYPDKSFYAFGYEAEIIYTSKLEKSNSDSDSDSDLEDEEKPTKENNCDGLYYFNRFNLTNNVSIFN